MKPPYQITDKIMLLVATISERIGEQWYKFVQASNRIT
jgi:hypothetical protein